MSIRAALWIMVNTGRSIVPEDPLISRGRYPPRSSDPPSLSVKCTCWKGLVANFSTYYNSCTLQRHWHIVSTFNIYQQIRRVIGRETGASSELPDKFLTGLPDLRRVFKARFRRVFESLSSTKAHTTLAFSSTKSLCKNMDSNPSNIQGWSYKTRQHIELNSNDFVMEEDHDAATTVGATSSPPDRHFRNIELPDDVLSHDFGASDDDGDYAASSRAPKLDDAQKTIQVLRFLSQFSRFSLRLVLEQLFTSENSEIKNRRGR
ncbi:hypothetical protein R3P38DRAFT_2816423 [Favolaschia claudopus]|uniref:Uncharacterized protein n=1 Tax=Favolaschia claudopus TaxID=2862362 RepID=A0AAV9YZ31_9AGAR